jgi:hypothetical protein
MAADRAPSVAIWPASVQSSTPVYLLMTHSPTAGVLFSVRRMLSRSNAVICHARLSPAAATFSRNRSYSSQISLDQDIQYMSSSRPTQGSSPRFFPSQISPDQACGADCHLSQPHWPEISPSHHRSVQIKAYSTCCRLYRHKELTEILPSTHNPTA